MHLALCNIQKDVDYPKTGIKPTIPKDTIDIKDNMILFFINTC